MMKFKKNKESYLRAVVKAFALLVLIPFNIFAQVKLPEYPDSLFSTYYQQKASFAESLPLTKEDIVFIGNSITDGAQWGELLNDARVKSRGFSGDISAGIINRITGIIKRKPSKVFLLIGTNDLARGITPDSLMKNILLITRFVNQQSPFTRLYVQSILPVNNVFGKFANHTKNSEKIRKVNLQLEKNAPMYHYQYIDLHTSFGDDKGNLNTRFSNDGLHLLGEGYLLWKHLIYPYVYDYEIKPALIPLPQQLKWMKGYFPLYACKNIVIKNNSLRKEAELLQNKMSAVGWKVNIVNAVKDKDPFIELRLDKVNSPQLSDEAYVLKVRDNNILLKANTSHGIFNGIQTLNQLMRDGVMIDACEISDWPAFSWRGYMVDVGRNFQSMELLKQQIDVLAAYKLNLFHFHFTEDIAWRLQSKLYPQLTDADNMLRNKGMYYSEEDLKELIAYCKERYITLLPEIDMPGHSAAFKRAMGVDMQSDSGLVIIKNILKEFCATYDVPYLHIGGDEVIITNKDFMSEVIKLVQALGKKTVAWSPGGPLDDQTIRQLWMGDKIDENVSHLQYVDSRHLYLNHMDPLEAVVTIFNRQIGDKTKGDENALGGILCLWPDRRVEHEMDVFRMNPVYPGLLAFAERVWRGGGNKGWVANVGKPGSERVREFIKFETRLLDHKKEYFKHVPFPYVKQTDITWQLYGPYQNEGNLAKEFDPEKTDFEPEKVAPYKKIIGGTIVLRHWWAPMIEGALDNPEDSTTWYAYTKIWSDENQIQYFWVGFNNLSRSPATDSPMPGTWDNHKSEVWVNGKKIEPPHWKHGGQTGHPEIPLIDEGYEYRKPTRIQLHKGWNRVLIKAPIGSFKGKDWQNPEKWMFTFVPVNG